MQALMKNKLLLLAVLGIGGYFVYTKYFKKTTTVAGLPQMGYTPQMGSQW